MRVQVSNKITMLNDKAETDMTSVKNEAKKYAQAMRKDAITLGKEYTDQSIVKLRAELRNYIDEKYKTMIKAMRNESDIKVKNEVRERLQVPGLIGENSQFSTLANFLTTFY